MALLSQRGELFHADNPRFHEQFQLYGGRYEVVPVRIAPNQPRERGDSVWEAAICGGQVLLWFACDQQLHQTVGRHRSPGGLH
jgi:hypothetical protein